jgi:multiple sugar transport system permease protein
VSSPALRSRSKSSAALLLAPYLILTTLFAAIPVLLAVTSSLHDKQGNWSLSTYSKVFSDYRFLPALENVAGYVLVFVPLVLAASTVLALVLHSRHDRAATGFRLVYYLPGIVVGAPLVVLWLFMLSPSLSPFGPVLAALGWESTSQAFVQGNPAVIFAIMGVFASVGGWIVVLHGALDNVAEEMQEAARLDGCNALQLALYVKLPQIRRQLVFIGLVSFAGATQLVAEPSIIASAIPGTVSNTWSLNQLSLYYAFSLNNFPAANVIAVLLLAIAAVTGAIVVFGVRGYSVDTDD